MKGVKLALGAVDATDWAIEGTVTCAKREEGRGLLARATAAGAAAFGTELAAGAIVAAGLAAVLTGAAASLTAAGTDCAEALVRVLVTVPVSAGLAFVATAWTGTVAGLTLSNIHQFLCEIHPLKGTGVSFKSF